jgi:hypothetical protein
VVDPLPSPNGLDRPGLAHPPPGWGDGLRESDIRGVPGMVGKTGVWGALWRFKGCGTFGEELRRRWCEKDSEIEEEEEIESGFKDARSTDGTRGFLTVWCGSGSLPRRRGGVQI